MQRENPYPQQQGKNDDLNVLVGRSLGQFRIVERIGAGGMATVFKAYQPNLDRYVAIKVLPAYHARDPIFVKRFVQERNWYTPTSSRFTILVSKTTSPI